MDELLIKNFVMTFLILLLVGELFYKNYKMIRIVLASTIATVLTAIMIIFDIQSILSKVFVMSMMNLLAFHVPATKSDFFVSAGAVLLITFLIGGMASSSIRKVWEMIGIGIICFIALCQYMKYYQTSKWKLRNYYDVECRFEKKPIHLKAFLDTGNFLTYGLQNIPVIIASEKALKGQLPPKLIRCLLSGKLADLETSILKNIKPITYSSIGAKNQIEYGIKVKNVKIIAKKKVMINKAVILISRQSFDDYDALIGFSVLEGGICNGNIVNIQSENQEIFC